MNLSQHLRYTLPILLYCALIFFLSSQSTVGTSHDKTAHFLAYGGMGFLFFRFFRIRGSSFTKAYLFAVLCATLYGVSDEIHQYFVPGRNADVFDAIADCLGAMMGSPLYELFYRIRISKTSSAS